MTSFSTLIGSLGVSLSLLVGFSLVYFLLLFVGGLMLYYFTGGKPGKHILSNLMNFGARLYAYIWTYVCALFGLVGLSLVFKAIVGSLFSGFAYSTRGGSTIAGTDLQTGLVLLIVSAVVWAVHFGLIYLVESKQQRKGTVLSKSFIGIGLFTMGFIFFGVLFMFAGELVSYINSTNAISRSAYPGASLSILLASFPFWAYYALRALMIMKHEK